MAAFIIDRRRQGRHKSAVNRQRFLKRFRRHIREAVSDAVNKLSITDMERGEEISIPRKDISEPVFRHVACCRATRNSCGAIVSSGRAAAQVAGAVLQVTRAKAWTILSSS